MAQTTIMSITRTFLLMAILFHVSSTNPISRHFKLMVKCGQRNVAYAMVHFHEFENDHPKFENPFSHLHRKTDQHGHYHFYNEEEIISLEGKNIKVMVKDSCDLDHEKPIECNLPYHQFEVPFNDIPLHENSKDTLILDLTSQLAKKHRGRHCS
uniref:TransThyretin-Related family domain n=1 Tax=Caenorhabditis tropicalis TaxID=1561998 RepID=A0A1I7TGG8_9PELO